MVAKKKSILGFRKKPTRRVAENPPESSPAFPDPHARSEPNRRRIVWFDMREWTPKRKLVDSSSPRTYSDGYGKQLEEVKKVMYPSLQGVELFVSMNSTCEIKIFAR